MSNEAVAESMKIFGDGTVAVDGYVARTASNGVFYVTVHAPSLAVERELSKIGGAPAHEAADVNAADMVLGFGPSNLCIYETKYNKVRPYRGEPMSNIGISVGAPVKVVWAHGGSANPKVVVGDSPHTFFDKLKGIFR